MVICCDTSFLFSLYGDDSNTPAALRWLKANPGPLSISKLNEFELANALRFAEFRRALTPGSAARCLEDVATDLANGRLLLEPFNLAAVLEEASRLSATHTVTAGHRSFDILHVAAALQQKALMFLTFDQNQRRLAEAEDLIVPF